MADQQVDRYIELSRWMRECDCIRDTGIRYSYITIIRGTIDFTKEYIGKACRKKRFIEVRVKFKICI